MRKIALFILLAFVLALSSCFVWAGGKSKQDTVKYTQKSVKLADIENQMKAIIGKENEANQFIADLNKQKIFLQGQYSIYLTLPDSFIVKPDSLVK